QRFVFDTGQRKRLKAGDKPFLTAAEARLVNCSRNAILETGISEPYFKTHFELAGGSVVDIDECGIAVGRPGCSGSVAARSHRSPSPGCHQYEQSPGTARDYASTVTSMTLLWTVSLSPC